MSAVNSLNNNNLLVSSQLIPVENTHNSSSEKIEIIWKNSSGRNTKRMEISCPRVIDKNLVFKRLEGGNIALRHTTWYKITYLNPDFILRNRDLYVQKNNGEKVVLETRSYKLNYSIDFRTPNVAVVEQWGENYSFCFQGTKEKWTCDQICIVDYPNLMTTNLLKNQTTTSDQDNGGAIFSENTEHTISILPIENLDEVFNWIIAEDANLVPVFETTAFSESSLSTTATDSNHPAVVENDKIVPVLEKSTPIPTNAFQHPQIEGYKRKEMDRTVEPLENKDPKIILNSFETLSDDD